MTNDWNGNSNWAAATAPQSSTSIWANFDSIEPKRAKNEYVPAGVEGVVKVVQMKTIQSVKNNNRPVFICTIELVEGVGGEVGVRWDWVAKADELPYLQNIKSLVCALNPEGDPRTFGSELMEQLTSPDQPAAGLTVRLRSESILTRSGTEFTKCHWSPS